MKKIILLLVLCTSLTASSYAGPCVNAYNDIQDILYENLIAGIGDCDEVGWEDCVEGHELTYDIQSANNFTALLACCALLGIFC